MKKFYAVMLSVAAGLTMNAQTLTQSNNAPAVGDMYGTRQCDSLNVTVGASGAAAVWNFTALTIHTPVTSYSTIASTTPSYPTGAVVVTSGISNMSYYTTSATDLKYYGGNISVGTVAANLTYTSPAIFATYPMSLNTTSTAAIGGSINITQPTAVSGTFLGNSVTNADGTGTLMLPGGANGTYSNVIRVVTTQTLNYTASFLSGAVIQQNYNFYTPTVKAPLLTISITTVTSGFSSSTQSMVTVNKDYLQSTPTGINENAAVVSDLQVYPNPASSQLNFSTANQLVKEIRVYDITGKLIETQVFANGASTLDVTGYNKGIYMYSLLSTNGEAMKSGKFTVTH